MSCGSVRKAITRLYDFQPLAHARYAAADSTHPRNPFVTQLFARHAFATRDWRYGLTCRSHSAGKPIFKKTAYAYSG